MLVPERHRRLLEHLRRDGAVSVEDLSLSLAVSASTVRRDLAQLESLGRLHRAHGGAFVEPGAARPEVRTGPGDAAVGDGADAAKERIGSVAAERVVDGMTIMILAGSTTQTMLPHLADRFITVVTNGLDIGYELSRYPNVSLVMLGGVLQREQMTLLGPFAEQNMADLHVDVMFAGAHGIHPEIGVTGNKVIQAGQHHAMLKHTASLVVLADATKIGRRGPTLLARMDQIDTVVTDRDVDAAMAAAMREHGTEIVIC